MQVITQVKDIKFSGKSVVALGVFDGVHKAHRLIISSAVKYARKISSRSVVLTFWPHPQGQASLISLGHRLRLIEDLGVDVCVVIRFNRKFSEISAENFVKSILLGHLNVCAVFIGENFRFGKNAGADAAVLKKFAGLYNFRTKVFKVSKIGRAVISSTMIRGLIRSGKLKVAQRILMRPVSVLGTVIKGRSIALKLGFPTANIDPHHEILPPSGIYAVRVILGRQIYPGICYIGKSPTFFGSSRKQTVEAHIFDFHENIYGRDLEIQFIRKIRSENKFSSPQALTKQIKKDIIKAKFILSRH